MEIELGSSNARGKSLSLAVVGIAIALALLDFVVLRGERVDGATVRLSPDDPALIEIDRVGEEHLVEISTRRRRGGETTGRTVSYRLEDPDGRIIVEESELVTRKRRFVRFNPDLPGEYRLFVEDPGLFGGSGDSARVSVYVNDRRILGRFVPF
jgi:hypothetical protein